MKKRVYNKPMLMAEAFVPQEYVAACFSLTCIYGEEGSKDPYDIQHGWGWGEHCGMTNSQSIKVSEDNKNIISAVETKNGNNLEITFTDSEYKTALSMPHPVVENEVLYWKTSFWGTTYYHKGKVDVVDGKRVSHS